MNMNIVYSTQSYLLFLYIYKLYSPLLSLSSALTVVALERDLLLDQTGNALLHFLILLTYFFNNFIYLFNDLLCLLSPFTSFHPPPYNPFTVIVWQPCLIAAQPFSAPLMTDVASYCGV